MYFTQNICISHITIISPIAIVFDGAEPAAVKSLHLIFICFARYFGVGVVKRLVPNSIP